MAFFFMIKFVKQIISTNYLHENYQVSKKKIRLKLVTLVKFLIINNSYENEDAKIQ